MEDGTRSTKTFPSSLETFVPYGISARRTSKLPRAVAILRTVCSDALRRFTITPFATTCRIWVPFTWVPPPNRRTGWVAHCQVEPEIESAPSNRQGSSELTVAPSAWTEPFQLVLA